ncbi:MAG: DUF3194 domain-containing protein [Candidatus Thorarchaeota archaeon]|jgi:hypothetical protein
MKPIVEKIGIPQLSEEELELLAEKCEDKITKFLFQMIPSKSIEELVVSCSVELSENLDLEVQIDIVQKYKTGHSLNELTEQATEHGVKWFEESIRRKKEK